MAEKKYETFDATGVNADTWFGRLKQRMNILYFDTPEAPPIRSKKFLVACRNQAISAFVLITAMKLAQHYL